MKLLSGLPSTDVWRVLRAGEPFRGMEAFSDSFLATHRKHLKAYAQKWVADPLHQWSRIWEYLFVLERLEAWRAEAVPGQVRILDAGSGITFFPYYVAQRLGGCRLTCCDSDSGLSGIFHQVNAAMPVPAEFCSADVQRLPFADASFDALYCVSVLEHMDRPDEVVDEFARVLTPNGVLLVTFDISLDGKADVPLAGAQRLRERLRRRFSGDAGETGDLAAMCRQSDVLTTAFVGNEEPDLLPWRSAKRSRIARWLRPNAPVRVPKLLTVFGESYRKAA